MQMAGAVEMVTSSRIENFFFNCEVDITGNHSGVNSPKIYQNFIREKEVRLTMLKFMRKVMF